MTKPAHPPKGHFGWSLIDGPEGFNRLRDVLHDFSAQVPSADPRFRRMRGNFSGVLQTLMACGMEFPEACQLIWQALPTDFEVRRLPFGYQEYFSPKVKK